MDGKKKESNVKMNLSPIAIALCVAGVGLILIIITSFGWGENPGAFITTFKNVLNSLGATLVSVGLVSILIEISTINSVVNKAIKTILNDDIPLESYSDNFLKRLKNRITAKISGNSINKLQKSIYLLEPNLLNLTKSLYYEYHNMRCDVIPNKNNNLFTKKISIEYKIINEFELENHVRFGLSLYDIKPNMTDDERKSSIKIKKFTVNEADLINDPHITTQIIPTNIDDAYEYDYMYKFERPLQKCREHTVKLEYEYITAQSDLTQSWKLKYPCKKTEHTISIKGNDNWGLKVNAFASFYHNDSELGKSFKAEQSVDKSAKIEFNEWTIPGAGYVISYNNK